MTQSLTRADGNPADVSVTLLAGSEQRRLSYANSSALEVWPYLELRDGTFRHAVSAVGDVRGRTRSDAPGDVGLGRFTTHAPFHFHFYRTAGGPIDVDLNCEDNYTAVRMIQGRFGAARLESGSWVAPVSPDAQHTLWVRLQFPKPPPARAEWPTRDTLDLGE